MSRRASSRSSSASLFTPPGPATASSCSEPFSRSTSSSRGLVSSASARCSGQGADIIPLSGLDRRVDGLATDSLATRVLVMPAASAQALALMPTP
ncbi:hypothetical protein CHELA20_50416 [Hyphomicrobiales bacterium]|nr:hypothetical protein CHELA20_50416 [Hyphomicrobiales bacterium]CAH1679648.1 hypothetical protein CHELA41_24710 [Hyphomicrobiales bacterium]